jgi:4-hydroxy-4-methyl-2-oxoglutarate aldolase
VLPIDMVNAVADAAVVRLANEESKRDTLASGILGMDLYSLRPLLDTLGVTYVDRLPES